MPSISPGWCGSRPRITSLRKNRLGTNAKDTFWFMFTACLLNIWFLGKRIAHGIRFM